MACFDWLACLKRGAFHILLLISCALSHIALCSAQHAFESCFLHYHTWTSQSPSASQETYREAKVLPQTIHAPRFCYNSFHFSGKAFWMRRPGMQLMLQFIPKVFSGVEVTVLCRTIKFFHINHGKPCIHAPCFVHQGIVMLEYVWAPLGTNERKLECCNLQRHSGQSCASNFVAKV